MIIATLQFTHDTDEADEHDGCHTCEYNESCPCDCTSWILEHGGVYCPYWHKNFGDKE